jgi:hypothetical protein
MMRLRPRLHKPSFETRLRAPKLVAPQLDELGVAGKYSLNGRQGQRTQLGWTRVLMPAEPRSYLVGEGDFGWVLRGGDDCCGRPRDLTIRRFQVRITRDFRCAPQCGFDHAPVVASSSSQAQSDALSSSNGPVPHVPIAFSFLLPPRFVERHR